MFKNYFKISLRTLWKNKIFSAINIIGLSIGISASLVIYLLVQYDFGFDKFEKDGDRIYRVVTNMKFAGDPFNLSGVPTPLHAAVRSEVTGLDETVYFSQFNGKADVTIPKGNTEKPQIFRNQGDVIFTDEHYFNLLSYQWMAGSPKNLNTPFKVVLTEDRAKQYFPSRDINAIIGKEVYYNDSIKTTVAGVIKSLTQNTDFIFKEFISLSTIPSSGLKENYGWDSWTGINGVSQLYVKLSKGTTEAAIEARFKTILKKYNKEANGDAKNTEEFKLQPLNDLHFNGTYGTYGRDVAHKPTLYGMLVVAAFLLLLGCINFINLTTAQATQRAKEIGIRKTMGSSRSQLMLQFLHETFLLTVFATILSIILTPLLLKVFADFVPSGLHFSLTSQPGIIVFLTLLVITVSFLAGFYPAVILSKFNPVLVLKNQAYLGTSTTRKTLLRKTLTVSQFFIAQVFVMATVIAAKQIYYMVNADMGFKKDAIISFSIPFNYNNFLHPDSKRFVLLNQLKAIPGIERVSLSSSTPATNGWSTSTMTYKDGKKEIETDVHQKSGDTNYLKLFNIKLLAGRNVEQSDTPREYLINETYMHILGFKRPADALNKILNGRPIVGVMADFHEQSLHQTIKPLVFYGETNFCFNFDVALRPQAPGGTTWQSAIKQIEQDYKKLYPDDDFHYEFLDESIAKFYTSEQNIAKLLNWATGLAIFISCMGLLGLVIYTTNLRRKEIGVRKVLGASVANIVTILSKDFMMLVLIAFVVAIPVVWWAMNKWLENFAYKTTVNWWVFALSGSAMALLALLTLSIQTVKAAVDNPVKSLRTE
ncbi:MAG TPA: FtsX-like permease family protein [Chitinophagaceae bacterium]|nr:FtsX-like permease family protein [Chitinophagaceae bacterium]